MATPGEVVLVILIGPHRSPCPRRATAMLINAYGVVFERQPLSGLDDRVKVRAPNAPGRIPALAADDSEPPLAQRLRAEEPAFTVAEHSR